VVEVVEVEVVEVVDVVDVDVEVDVVVAAQEPVQHFSVQRLQQVVQVPLAQVSIIQPESHAVVSQQQYVTAAEASSNVLMFINSDK
jgi:hypothetical protein